MASSFPGQERARHMGELKRGPDRWNVYLELQPDAELAAFRGRIHFVGEEGPRSTGWVFLEREEKDIVERFGEFSAVELLQFVEAIPS
jgi:hypothetical protein